MMKLKKVFWFLRGLIYGLFLGSYGKLSYLGKPLYIGGIKRIFIGEKVRIFPGSRMEVIGKENSIRFGNNISIGQNFHVISGGELLIGSNTTISANVFVSNLDHDYKQIDKHILEQEDIITETRIGENCFIGYGATLQPGTILGKQCIVGAGAVVKGDFPDYSIIVGVPGRIIKRYNTQSNIWQNTNKQGEFI